MHEEQVPVKLFKRVKEEVGTSWVLSWIIFVTALVIFPLILPPSQ